jgi:hypothetical protein
MMLKKALLFSFGCALALWATRAQASLLIAPSESDNPAFRAEVAGLLGDTVDYYDARVATPTLGDLSAYDAVFTWANFAYFDEVGFGDVLADYVDAGGRVILGAFTTYTSGNNLSGDIMTSGYSPVTSPSGSNHFAPSAYVGDGVVLWCDVDEYTATYRDFVVLQGSGILDGTFADGEIAAAYRPDLGVIYLGGMETIGGVSGDYAQLLVNAVNGGGDCLHVVPEPSSLALVTIGAVGLVLRRRRQKNAA